MKRELIAGICCIIAAIALLVGIKAVSNLKEAEAMEKLPEEVQVSIEYVEKRTWDVPLEPTLQYYIADLCDRYEVEPELALAVIGQESNYDSDAIGDDGKSFGLMQVQPAQHPEKMEKLAIDDIMNPYQNVEIGIAILAEHLKTGSTRWALMAYNGGIKYANEMTYMGRTSDYAESVMYLAEQLK